MATDKIGAYLGFSVRANKIVYGTDSLEKKKKGVYLLLSDESMSDNSKKILTKMREKFGCVWCELPKGLLSEYLCKPNVLSVGLTEKSLAEAVLKIAEAGEQYKIYSSGGRN